MSGEPGRKPYIVFLSLPFVISFVFGSSLLAFAIGQWARIIVRDANQQKLSALGFVSEPDTLPTPILKKLPKNVYTSKNYDTGRTVTSASVIAQLQEENRDWVVVGDTTGECGIEECGIEDKEDEDDSESDEEVHEPAGQHLLMDIENLDGSFLNSKERLAQAMMDLVNMSGLTLLSYHCHEMTPAGVSCAGVLLESHVSFHTWPAEGVITLDLFTCGPKSLLPLVKTVEDLFFVPRVPSFHGEHVEPPHMLWSFKRRGFQSQSSTEYDASSGDVYNFMLGVMEYEMKDLIASTETEYQSIEVFDLIHPRFRTVEQYKRSLSNDGSYEARNPEFFRPDRVLYLDGVMQSRRYGESSYHEALVHPGMFAHEEPKNVVIIGGGEGATLREILKHDTVEKVIMVEADQGMVDFAKDYLMDWNDCSDIVGSADSCFDDPRVELIVSDAVAWFIEETKPNSFDVVIMDALDPGDNAEFSDYLFSNPDFATAAVNSLTEYGVFVCQTGEGDLSQETSMRNTRKKDKITFRDALVEAGIESMRSYEESHSGFMRVWSFLIAFKTIETKSIWLSNEAEVNLAIHQRIRGTKSGKPMFQHFDGATMGTFHYPSRAEQIVFCRTDPEAAGCKRSYTGINPDSFDIPIEDFEVKTSTIEKAGRGVFTKVDIPKGGLIAPKETTKAMYVPPKTYAMIYDLLNGEIGKQWNFLHNYFYGYGYGSFAQGLEDRTIDPGILTFINHGCNRTYNVSPMSDISEQNADPKEMLQDEETFGWEEVIFNTYVDRNYHVLIHEVDGANRDLKAGEEIFDNFLNYAISEEMWEYAVKDLRSMCAGESLGNVQKFEDDN